MATQNQRAYRLAGSQFLPLPDFGAKRGKRGNRVDMHPLPHRLLAAIENNLSVNKVPISIWALARISQVCRYTNGLK